MEATPFLHTGTKLFFFSLSSLNVAAIDAVACRIVLCIRSDVLRALVFPGTANATYTVEGISTAVLKEVRSRVSLKAVLINLT